MLDRRRYARRNSGENPGLSRNCDRGVTPRNATAVTRGGKAGEAPIREPGDSGRLMEPAAGEETREGRTTT